MGRNNATLVTVSLAIIIAAPSSGAQLAGAKPADVEHVCSILTKAEVAKYVTRGRDMDDKPGEMNGICDYGGGWGQVLVYSGPNAEQRFDRLLKAFKKDKEPRHPLPSLGADGWVIYPRPDNEYQSIGAFTHARVGQHVVSVFVDADEGKVAESATGNAEALTKLVLSRLR
jgi:hypothetical protein